jgi:hypothetical protein
MASLGLRMYALNALYCQVRQVLPFVIQFWVVASLGAHVSKLAVRFPI